MRHCWNGATKVGTNDAGFILLTQLTEGLEVASPELGMDSLGPEGVPLALEEDSLALPGVGAAQPGKELVPALVA